MKYRKYWWLALAAVVPGAILGFVWPASADPLHLLTRHWPAFDGGSAPTFIPAQMNC